MKNQTCPNQNSLREDSKLKFLHLIKKLKTGRIIYIVQGRTPWKFSSGLIQNEVLVINSKHPYYVDHFERKPQANISSSDQGFEKQEEELIYYKGEHHD